MDKNDHQFIPETVDEQVDQLLLGQRDNSPEGHMVNDLQHLYQDDAHSLDRVWQRLETDAPGNQEHTQPGAKRRSQPLPAISSLSERSAEGAKILAFKGSRRMRASQGGNISRHLSLIAAAFVATLIVGSMLWVFGAARPSSTITSTNNTNRTKVLATPVPLARTSDIYALGNKGLFRLDPKVRKVLWRVNDPQNDYIRVLPVSNKVYVLTAGKFSARPAAVSAFDAISGEQLWSHALGSNHIASDMLISGNKIYVSQLITVGGNYKNTSELAVLNLTDGSPVATYHIPGEANRLGADDNMLYVGTDRDLQALDPTNGAQRWEVPFKAKNNLFFRSLQSLNGVLYASISDSSEVGSQSAAYVAAYKASSGKQIWGTPVLSHDALSAFVIDGDVMYFGALVTGPGPFSGMAYAYDIRDGHQIWMQKIDGGVQQAPVVSDGKVYVNADGGNQFPGHVVALDATHGQFRWEQKLDNSIVSSLCMVNGVLYVSNQGFTSNKSMPDELYAFDVAGGKLLWKDAQFGSLNVLIPAV